MMMSYQILLFLAVFVGVFTSTTAQAVCVDPIQIGELRVERSKKCVNIEGYDGVGNVNTEHCDGYNDQQIILCGDGTIRNTESPNNCLNAGSDGNGNVVSSACRVYPSLPNYQKWRLGRSHLFYDSFGIEQEAREILNEESNLCLDVRGTNGEGTLMTWNCQDATDQYFFFRSKGQLIAHGRIQVQESGLCLDVVSGSSGPALSDNVRIYECENSPDQYFGFYENGEIINEKSRMCINVAGYDGTGDIDMWACDYWNDQRWIKPSQTCDGDYCSFVNRMSGACLNIHGTAGSSGSNVYTHDCTGEQDQRFKFVTGTWVSPTATWALVGCNENGEVSQTVSNSISYSTTVTEETAIEIGAEIEAGYSFGSVTVSTTFSHSLAREWSESQESSQDISFTCQVYDSGETFTGGCMWQIKLTTHQTTNEDDELVWKPQIVRCTRGNTAPTCPPFTRCQDEECTMCEETMFGRKKLNFAKKFLKKKSKHSAKRAFWKKVPKDKHKSST